MIMSGCIPILVPLKAMYDNGDLGIVAGRGVSQSQSLAFSVDGHLAERPAGAMSSRTAVGWGGISTIPAPGAIRAWAWRWGFAAAGDAGAEGSAAEFRAAG